MKPTQQAASAVIAAALVAGIVATAAWGDDEHPRARAIVQGAPGSGITGWVTFKERKGNFPEPGVEVEARVRGLTPGQHGFHIHEVGLCNPTATPRFGSAGGHFDPGPFGMANPDTNHPFHTGDLPNLVADRDGVATFKAVTSRVTLSPGLLSVFDDNGSAVIVHQNPDQGVTGQAGSGVSGGPRIACGVIVPAQHDDAGDDDEDDDD